MGTVVAGLGGGNATLVYMRETCASAEFYDALDVLVCRFGGAVVLTVVMGESELAAVSAELKKRGMQARLEGARLIIEVGG